MKRIEDLKNQDFNEFLKNASQIELYYAVAALGQQRHMIERMYHHGTLEYQKMHEQSEERFLMQVMVGQELARFGINAVNKDLTPTSEYWAWFYRFDSYTKSLTAEEYATLETRINNREDTTDINPR